MRNCDAGRNSKFLAEFRMDHEALSLGSNPEGFSIIFSNSALERNILLSWGRGGWGLGVRVRLRGVCVCLDDKSISRFFILW